MENVAVDVTFIPMMSAQIKYAIVVLALLSVWSCSDTSTSVNIPPSIDGLQVQHGFQVSYYARDIGAPRFMGISPDGNICVTLPGKNHIVKLIDSTGNGEVDAQQVIAEGLPNVNSMDFHSNTLYAAGITTVWRLFDTNSDGVYEEKEAIIDDLPDGGHWTRTVIVGPDDNLYVSIGSSCNICEETDARRAAVVRYNLNGTGEEIFATGLRNAVGIQFRPNTSELWGTVNGRDHLHDDLPPEEVVRIREGGFHGWPYAYGQKVTDPAFDNYSRAENSIPPDVEMQAHAAPLGMEFYTGDKFPSEYQGNLFVAQHGSWNRSVPVGPKIVRIKADAAGQPSSQTFIAGWQDSGGDRWGRPVDVITGPNGDMFIADDENECIYKVSYHGGGGEEYTQEFTCEAPSPQTTSDSTNIAYVLPVESDVELRVYNHAGSLIRTMLDTHQVAGAHIQTWDGRNSSDEVVEPGEYVVQIRVNAGDQFFQRTYPVTIE